MDDIIVRYTDMPCNCHAVTAVDTDGVYNIYVNTNIGIIEQQKALKHELKHIKLNHFYDNKPVIENELEVI